MPERRAEVESGLVAQGGKESQEAFPENPPPTLLPQRTLKSSELVSSIS